MTVEGLLLAVMLLMPQYSPTLSSVELNVDEVRCLSENIWHESRSESAVGQAAVAWATRNRVNDRRHPDTYCEVVYERSQFSWTLVKDAHVSITKKPDRIAWIHAVETAIMVMSGLVDDPTDGSDHFLAKKSLRRLPTWYKDMDVVVKLGRHTFYREAKYNG